MEPIAPEQARAYVLRWAEMTRHETMELRAATIEQKARQLDALMASRDLLPAGSHAEREAAELRERWRRIRAALSPP
jgi:hypothetical protein